MLNTIGEGQILLADRAYDSDHLRSTLAERRAWANVKPVPNWKNIPAFSQFLYRSRNFVERFFSKIKHHRAVATGFEKHDANYLPLVKLAAVRIWMRFMSRRPSFTQFLIEFDSSKFQKYKFISSAVEGFIRCVSQFSLLRSPCSLLLQCPPNVR